MTTSVCSLGSASFSGILVDVCAVSKALCAVLRWSIFSIGNLPDLHDVRNDSVVLALRRVEQQAIEIFRSTKTDKKCCAMLKETWAAIVEIKAASRQLLEIY